MVDLPKKPVYMYPLTLARQRDLVRARRLTGQATSAKAIDEVFSTFFKLLSNVDGIPPMTLRRIVNETVLSNYAKEVNK